MKLLRQKKSALEVIKAAVISLEVWDHPKMLMFFQSVQTMHFREGVNVGYFQHFYLLIYHFMPNFSFENVLMCTLCEGEGKIRKSNYVHL